MELRTLGRTGLQVSVLGLGTVKIGRLRGLKYPAHAQPAALPSDEKAMELLRSAAEVGINLIDTAPAYGVSEERLGDLMARGGWFGGRDRWVVCTKAGEEFDESADGGNGAASFDFSAAAMRASAERSLKRLRTDRLDVLLIHSDGRDEWVIRESGAMKAMRELKARGLVRAIGISTKTVEGGLLAVEMCDVVMVTHNPSYTAEQRVIDAALDAGVGVLVKKGLESGHAADPAHAIRFVLGTPGVSAMIVGTTSPEHLRTNAAAVETVGE
jgi:aryl-alcohol dehydrogenase-like predicted oxidoreductase